MGDCQCLFCEAEAYEYQAGIRQYCAGICVIKEEARKVAETVVSTWG